MDPVTILAGAKATLEAAEFVFGEKNFRDWQNRIAKEAEEAAKIAVDAAESVVKAACEAALKTLSELGMTISNESRDRRGEVAKQKNPAFLINKAVVIALLLTGLGLGASSCCNHLQTFERTETHKAGYAHHWPDDVTHEPDLCPECGDYKAFHTTEEEGRMVTTVPLAGS